MTEPTKLEKARTVVLESFSHYVNAMYPHQEHPAYRVRFERDMNANTEEVDALIEAAREEAKHPTCEWVGDDDAPNASAWTTFCNKEVYLGSSPAVCGLIYCPYCGGKIEEASEELLHDRVHRDRGRGRAARTVRSRQPLVQDLGELAGCVACSWLDGKVYKVDPRCPIHAEKEDEDV